METRPGEVVLLAEEAQLVRSAIRMGLNAAELFDLMRKDPEIPAWLREKLPEPLDLKTKMVLRLVEDRLPEGLKVVE